MKLISFIVPVFNEENNIPNFVSALREMMKKASYEYELIFIDDGSSDRSFEEIRGLSQTDSRIKALALSRNFGSHSAITAGLHCSQGDASVVLAADMQDPPPVVLQFIKKWEEGFEVVWGVRKKRADSKSKKFFSGLFYRLFRKWANSDYPLGGTGSFCLIDRKVRESVKECRESNRVVFGLIAWAGFKQAEVGYDRPERQFGLSKWSPGKMLKAAIDALTAYSYIPLRLSVYVGIFFLFISISIIFYVFIDWFFHRNVQPGWPTLMISIYLLGGTQLLFLGVIGEYIWRISQDVKGRPNFIVREQIGFTSEKCFETSP